MQCVAMNTAACSLENLITTLNSTFYVIKAFMIICIMYRNRNRPKIKRQTSVFDPQGASYKRPITQKHR